MTRPTCLKCGSDEVATEIEVLGHGLHAYATELVAQVYKKPKAMLFKGAMQHRLYAQVCGHCGFTELYAKSAEKLVRFAREHSHP